MKSFYTILLIPVLFVAGCQATTPILDPLSVQNTAIAIAWTTVSQTQTVNLAATVNAQGTQLAILTQPTIAITPTQNLLMVDDNGIKFALLAILGWSESEISYSPGYNDGQLAIGSYSRIGSMSSNDNGFWFVERDSSGQWVATYVSQGYPLCDKVRAFNIQYPVTCMDANGNEMMNQWQGQ